MTTDSLLVKVLLLHLSLVAGALPVVNALSVPRNNEPWSIRPFETTRDLSALTDICRHVFRGTDNLPSQAVEYEKDPCCEFLVLTTTRAHQQRQEHNNNNNNNEKTLLAVANLRRLDDTTGWLESVRTHPDHYGQGWSTRLLQHMLTHCKSINSMYPQRIMSATIDSNLGMQRVFQKLEMTRRPGRILMSDPLPVQSWRDIILGPDREVTPLECSPTWKVVTNAIHLEQALESIHQQERKDDDSRNYGAHLPGLWKLLGPQSPEIQASLLEGTVFVNNSRNAVVEHGTKTTAVMALIPRGPTHPVVVLSIVGSTDLLTAAFHHCMPFLKNQNDSLLVLVMEDSYGAAERLQAELPTGFTKSYLVYEKQLECDIPAA